MKKFFFLFTLSLFLSGFAQQVVKPTEKTKLLVYYFHITHRCNTCFKIENTTRKVLETYFPRELADGIIIFQTFNCELPENKKLVEKYQAYGATLALTSVINGKEAKIEDITDFAFSKIHEESKFIQGLRDKISQYLK